jgi:hypothetical protein
VVVSCGVHMDSLRRCLSYGLCKGGNSMVKLDCVLNGWTWVEGEI